MKSILDMSEVKGITENKDIDREILLHLSAEDLLNVCQINKYFNYFLCDDNFFHKKLKIDYPNSLKCFESDRYSYKSYYFIVNNYVKKLQKEFKYLYVAGNPEKQYTIFVECADHQQMLDEACKQGEVEIVKEAIKLGADIHNEYAFKEAVYYENLEVVKYLLSQGVDISVDDEWALRWASNYGYLEIVKYLVENGADIHVMNEQPLLWASRMGNLEVVKYLVSHGADVHVNDDKPMRVALINNYIDVIEYLRGL